MTEMRPPQRIAERYEEFYSKFRWDIPDRFNFGIDVVDRFGRDSERLALIWENQAGEQRRYTYRQMSALSARFANALRRQGIEKGDRVLVMLPRIPEWMVAIVGAMKLGAVPIPCVEMLTERDLAYRMENSGARAVICRAAHCSKFARSADAGIVRIAIGSADDWLDFHTFLENESEDFTPPVILAEDPAIMYYTSGSTGHPKGVVHASRAIYAWRVSAKYWLDLSAGDLIWCTADTGWSKAGTSILFGPWSMGACSLFYDGGFDAERRLEMLARHRVNVYCAPGTELYRLVNEDIASFDLSALRRVVSAGEAVNPVVAKRWEEASGIRIDEAYGQTEALMMVLNYPGEPVKYGSMGRPSPGSELAVIGESGRILPPGEEGDLAMIPNPQFMLCYWRDEERFNDCFRQGPEGVRWYVTGDRAVSDEDGYLWYRGRSDDVINSAGYRIGPLEVENALLEHPKVQACAVVGAPDEERGEIVKAYVVLRAGVESSESLKEELAQHVKQITAPYKYPRSIEFIDELPMTLTGKIRRKDLRERARAEAKGG